MKLMKFFRLLFAAITLALLSSNAAHGAIGNIYETNNGMILRFSSGGGTPGTFASGLSNPKGIVFDGNGFLYVADAGTNSILKFNVIDASSSTFAVGLSSPIGLAMDKSGNLFEADAVSGSILKFAPDGTKTTFATGLKSPAGLAFDSSGNLYATEFNAGNIVKFTPAGAKVIFASGLSLPAGLAIDGAGNVFESDSGSNTIFKFAPDGTKTSFATGLSRPYGLSFESTGNLLEADNGSGSTSRFTPTGNKTVIFSSGFNAPQFLAAEPAQHELLNISTRGFVQTGDNILIGGFIIAGNGPVGTTVVVRATGPSLSSFGVATPLQDPFLELRDSAGVLIASNDNWKDTQMAQIQATKLAPTDDRESAIVTTLQGGSYTAIVRGANNTVGTAVVEVYNLK